MGLSKNTDST